MTTMKVEMKQAIPRRHTSKCMQPPLCVNVLDLWTLTLKTFSPIPTHMMNICGEFHWNLST